jgi:hypothetical protein
MMKKHHQFRILDSKNRNWVFVLDWQLTFKECHILRNFSQLTYLKFLVWCKLRDETSELFLPNLTKYVFLFFWIKQQKWHSFFGRFSLVVLELPEKNISDATLRNLSNHRKLEKLSFENNAHITSKGLLYLSHLTKLKSINMKGRTKTCLVISIVCVMFL